MPDFDPSILKNHKASHVEIPQDASIATIEATSSTVIHMAPPQHMAVAGSIVGVGVTRMIPLAIPIALISNELYRARKLLASNHSAFDLMCRDILSDYCLRLAKVVGRTV